MTKKDYELLAAVIRESFAFETSGKRAVFILDMEDALRADKGKLWNSRLWHEACTPEVTT